MAIKEIIVENFKGVGPKQTFSIRPITIFIGANSSGKSSCLHAVASLAQTIKLGNSAAALVLDDEYAHVHLGRFIEICHDKSYKEAMTLGVNVGTFSTMFGKGDTREGDATALYAFRGVESTEEVYIGRAVLTLGDAVVEVSREEGEKDSYELKSNLPDFNMKAVRKNNFFFRPVPVALEQKDLEKIKSTPDWLFSVFGLDQLQDKIEQELRDTLYLGPFRKSPLRRYPFRGSTANEVGPQGEATTTMLAHEYVQGGERPHFVQINRWLSQLNLAQSVGVARVGSSDLFDVKLTLTDGQELPIADLGYGLSQVLPVLTQCSFAPQDSTLLFEQPELHLHDGAARKLGDVFVETVREKNAHLMIETHSEPLVHSIFDAIRSGALTTEDVALYEVRRDEGRSHYKEVPISFTDGELDVDHPWARSLR